MSWPVVNPVGKLVATESFRNDRAGHQQLAGWLIAHGPVHRVGVEGTGSYGVELTRELSRSGLTVVEVNRPNRQRRRRHGKNDTVDAISAAMAVLSGEAVGTHQCLCVGHVTVSSCLLSGRLARPTANPPREGEQRVNYRVCSRCLGSQTGCEEHSGQSGR